MLKDCDYCDYETCVALKELGFDEKCHGHYEPLKKCFNTTSIKHCWCNSEVDDIGVIICPTLYEAQKWLREEKDIHIEVFFSLMDDKRQLHYDWHIVHNIRFDDDEYTYDCDVLDSMESYKSYEEALSKGIKAAIEILTNKENE